MKITNVAKEKNTVVFTVEVDKDLWKASLKKALDNAAKNIRIEGFRPGKAPASLVDKRINRGEAYQKAANYVVDATLVKLEESDEFNSDKYELLERPMLEIKDVNDDGLTLMFIYDIMPKVTLKDYTNFDIDWSKRKAVDDKEVDTEIENWVKRSQNFLDVTDRALKKDDIAVIDFVGSIDGVEFLGGKSENYNLKIGSKQFIDNFEDQLIGMNINDEKTIDVTFPEDYKITNYAGKKAQFKVTLKGIKLEKETKLDDDFVKSLKIDNVQTVAELKAYLKDNFQQRNDNLFKSEIQKELLPKIVEVVEVDYMPQTLMINEKRRIEQIFLNRLKEQNTTFEKYIKDNNLSVEAVQNVIEQDTINSIKYALAIEQIAEDQKVTVTDEFYKDYASKLARLYGLKTEEIIQRMKPNEEVIREELLNDLVIDKIIELNTKNAGNKKSTSKPAKEADKKPIKAKK